MYFKVLIIVFVLVMSVYEVTSKSINRNITLDDNKVVSIDVLDDFKANLTNLVKQMVEQHSCSRETPVFFYAEMPFANTIYNKNSIVKFNRAILNEGNHFSPGDSIFIAPQSALYMFAWSIQSAGGKTSFTVLKVDNIVKQKQYVHFGGSAGWFQTTRSIICRVRKGKHVWIETGNLFAENFFDNEEHTNTASSFMGLLLYKE